MLEIEVCEIRGKCPVHKVGDRIVIDDPEIVLELTDALCTHALSSLLHYVLTLEAGDDPVRLGLTKPDDREYACAPDFKSKRDQKFRLNILAEEGIRRTVEWSKQFHTCYSQDELCFFRKFLYD